MIENIRTIKEYLTPHNCQLIAVTKTHSVKVLKEAYDLGLKVFGENKVQELVEKYELLPNDIEWHMIGHLQSNKVKYIVPFIELIHSVDSWSLLKEINKQGQKINRVIPCLLQIHIAREETKFGFDYEEAQKLLTSAELASLDFIRIDGLMGMASHTKNESDIRNEFRDLKRFFDSYASTKTSNVELNILSMGMSSDYKLAVEEGSTLVRIGSALFGNREYPQ